METKTSYLAIPGVLLASLTDLPMDWFDPGRVAEQETDHGRIIGRTWAAVRGDDRVWRVYAPGTPDPLKWPEGQDPWERAAPAAIFTHERFPHDVNLDREQLAELADMIGVVADGRPVDPIEGIRWARPADRVGHPIVYVTVLR
ncbi:hypothetical protein I0C86_40730 [Plantactinospora sp. S1510]|uniref:Uncharacterized protein n=1 Tax=Plantactinospora alkalitolerans TaxID=2789879 RepID=A0ABS0HAS5_9ACTN|nr:hypothetical protein [Plantactinospora alkalitolerans]MBF9135207.1 hypothetical protein [Plantactinospora alkalitolerans]